MNTNKTMNMCLLTGIVMAIALTAGCASGPTRVEEDFGNSVRAMRAAQTADPVAAVAPDTNPVETTDGQRMENALEAYREDTGDRSRIHNERFDFSVDN